MAKYGEILAQSRTSTVAKLAMTTQDLWQLLAQTTTPRSFLEVGMSEGFVPNRRGLRCIIIGISARAWMERRPTHAAGGETELCGAFYSLARLLEFPVVPVFVFDHTSQASHKRGHEGEAAAWQQARWFQYLVHAFGYHVHLAPAGAEEELATLCRNHLIDTVVTDNVSTFMFGATCVIRNMEFLNEADDPVRVYTSTTAEGLSLSHGNWILLGLLVGSNGGGHGPGLQGCGLATALQIVKSNLGVILLQAAEQMLLPELDQYMKSWRSMLQCKLASDPNWHLDHGHIELSQAVGDTFPSAQDVIRFVKPVTSLSDCQSGPDPSLWVPRMPDLGRLGHLCERLFSWATGPGLAREFDRHVWCGACTRLLLMSVVFPGDKDRMEQIAAIVTSTTSRRQCDRLMAHFPMLDLTISTQPFYEASLSQMLNVREVVATDLDLEVPLEKQVSLPCAVVALALPGISDLATESNAILYSPWPSSFIPLLFPIREVNQATTVHSDPHNSQSPFSSIDSDSNDMYIN
ncbi:hypothetical protein AX14_003306 [Amanita brunnescens Koide BX004]|nr:hypothetical protein AX14_003306 [Amanita brunnescens Koide BX004]